MPLRRILVVLMVCLPLIANGWAAVSPTAAMDAIGADCPSMQDGMAMGADHAPTSPPGHRAHGCCAAGDCHCAGAHGVVALPSACPAVPMQRSTRATRHVARDPYVSPTLARPARPPIA